MSPTAAELRATYAGKKVLLTGHTGFKGAWLTLWLERLGAKVTGLALEPEADSVFLTAGVASSCEHRVADVRNFVQVRDAVQACQPDIVFHLAAQALVRKSYAEPLATIETNINGTAHVLEALRVTKQRCAVVVVSSDKCYENREWVYGYREDDAMGGFDPYSMSKGATELVTSSWRRSFFPPAKLAEHGVGIASARAGNVIGGGDWAADRIVPDCVRSLSKGEPIGVRSPHAIRPWQHVLEPLGGYLLLGVKLLTAARPQDFCEGWNFGPEAASAQPVSALAAALVKSWGRGSWIDQSDPKAHHEASLLRLSIDKAHAKLGWQPRWRFDETIARTVAWYRAQVDGASAAQLKALTLEQIAAYEAA
ncbi:MAG: CDP-glucose 4,6-dehydratase [Archangium sp.]|nr:CDP-glucose 4,6-dehydratase [Archangium sp.]